MSAYYELDYPVAARAESSARAAFIRRTYAHLAGAVLAFVGLETALFSLVSHQDFQQFFATAFRSPITLLIFFLIFVGAGAVARMFAHTSSSPAIQYLGLALYVAVQAVIFVPLLYIAKFYVNDPNLIAQAGIMTLCVFGGLTITVLVTGKDFSFLGPILCIAGFMVFGVIIAAILFGFTLGLGFSFLMVGIASAYILYDTSNVLHHYRTDQHVGAALELFASLALLFYYILRILIALSSNRD